MAYGPTREAAILAVRVLALRVAADCIDHGDPATIWQGLHRRISRWPSAKANRLLARLCRIGWTVAWQTGSHSRPRRSWSRTTRTDRQENWVTARRPLIDCLLEVTSEDGSKSETETTRPGGPPQFPISPYNGRKPRVQAEMLRSSRMELAIQIQIEELPEGLFLATSDELPGLVAQGRTVAEALEIARDVARKLIEARRERDGVPNLPSTSERRDYTIVVAA